MFGMLTRRFPAVLAIVIIGLAHGDARAEPPAAEGAIDASKRAIAEALFDQALEAMKASDYHTACPKFAESQRLAPSAGTSFNLGRCYQVTNRFASAWASFRQAAHIARRDRNDAILGSATTAANTLEPKLAKLIVLVPKVGRADGLQVLRDGVVLSPSLWGVQIPVDAGRNTLEAKAPGYLTWRHTLTIPTEPEVVTVEVPTLKKAPESTAPPAGPRRLAPNATSIPDASRADAAPSDGNTQRTVAYVTGGVGVASLAVGAGLGVHALAINDASMDNCGEPAGLDGPNNCTKEGKALRDEAQQFASGSIALLVAGGVATGFGLTLYLLAPSDDSDTRAPSKSPSAANRASLRVRAMPGGIALQGRW